MREPTDETFVEKVNVGRPDHRRKLLNVSEPELYVRGDDLHWFITPLRSDR